jgi:hypothetical protein
MAGAISTVAGAISTVVGVISTRAAATAAFTPRISAAPTTWGEPRFHIQLRSEAREASAMR